MKIIRICEIIVFLIVLRNFFIGICIIFLGDFVIEKNNNNNNIWKLLYKSLIVKSMFEIVFIY